MESGEDEARGEDGEQERSTSWHRRSKVGPELMGSEIQVVMGSERNEEGLSSG